MPTFEHVDIDLISRPSFVAELPRISSRKGVEPPVSAGKRCPRCPRPCQGQGARPRKLRVTLQVPVQFHYGLW